MPSRTLSGFSLCAQREVAVVVATVVRINNNLQLQHTFAASL
jgi:hypothetical protein